MKRNKRLKRFLKIFIPVFLVVFFCGSGLILVRTGDSDAVWSPAKKKNVWINKDENTRIVDPAPGDGRYPADSLLSYKALVGDEDRGSDLLFVNVRLTRDGELVIAGSDEIQGKKVAETDYADLREINLGEGFISSDGSAPYTGLTGGDIPDDVRPAKLGELFSYCSQYGALSYLIKIGGDKDAGKATADKLYASLTETGILDRALVWFESDAVGKYIGEKYPDMARAATSHERTIFYCNARFNMNRAQTNYKWRAIIVPAESFVRYDTICFINYAHKRNRAVFYTGVEGSAASALNNKSADAVIGSGLSL